jgi:hypothetical protein
VKSNRGELVGWLHGELVGWSAKCLDDGGCLIGGSWLVSGKLRRGFKRCMGGLEWKVIWWIHGGLEGPFGE